MQIRIINKLIIMSLNKILQQIKWKIHIQDFLIKIHY